MGYAARNGSPRIGPGFLTILLLVTTLAQTGIAAESLRVDRVDEMLVLTWDAGAPPYGVFRNWEAQQMALPGNQIATTEDSTYTEPFWASPGLSFFWVGPASDQHECGESLCSIEQDYCLVLLPGLPDFPISYECYEIPVACLPVDVCPCLVGENGLPAAAGFCQQQATGAYVVTVALP